MEDIEPGNKSLSLREFLAGTAAVLAGGSLQVACGGSTSTPWLYLSELHFRTNTRC